MCLVRPALLYLNVHVLKVFYEQINHHHHHYYYYFSAFHYNTVTVNQQPIGCDAYLAQIERECPGRIFREGGMSGRMSGYPCRITSLYVQR